MTSILIYIGGFFVFVALTMVIPGVKTIITPVWAGVGKGLLVLMSWSWGWVVFLVKKITNAHIEIVRHLILPDDVTDYTKRIGK
jgi:hypothetical protein